MQNPRCLPLTLLLCILFATSVLAQNDATCSASRPCKLGCCSTSGSCGFGPAFCGSGNCTSNCDATAECGQYAPAGKQLCPLNVCCSQYGFCGTTSAFCTDGCQNGCNPVQRPSCSPVVGGKKSIGYYESWSLGRKCDVMAPENINPALWTHLNYAFALIDPVSFRIAQMNSYDLEMYTRFNNLKLSNPALKTFISVGGWDAGGKIFSDMVSTTARRSAFIQSSLELCKTYAFDGIDIDWEYPVAEDRGSVEADFDNFVIFTSELKAAFGRLGVTVTLPSSYWYLKGFDIKSLEPHVDWFNIMSYDIHGTWDGNNPYTKKVINPHTNLTEINDAMDLLWRNDISPSKVVMGLGFYGRSFTLADPSCNTPGCPFSGGANAGDCTGQPGILSNAEIQRIISENNLEPILDETAAVKYIHWDTDQWVSYDDADTLRSKADYANRLCLAGTMVWAIDLDSTDSLSGQFLESGGDSNNRNNFLSQKSLATKKQNNLQRLAFWTPCMSDKDRRCPGGYHEIGMVGHGNVFDFDLYKEIEGCKGRLNRLLCMRDDVLEVKCQWHRNSKGGKFCDSSCPPGTYFLTQNSHPAGDRTGCSHGTYIAVCCEDFLTDAQACDTSAFDLTFSGGTANTGNRENEWVYVGVGEGPPFAAARRKKKRQNNSNYNICNPNYYAFPPPPSNYIGVYAGVGYVGVGKNGKGGTWTLTANKVTVTETIPPAIQTTTTLDVQRTCDGANYPQPCHHYHSVGIRSPFDLRRPLCPNNNFPFWGIGHNLFPNHWDLQHHTAWSRTWIQKSYVAPYNGQTQAVRCQRDEWPPYAIWRGRPGAYIRLLPGGENGGVANAGGSRWRFNEICKYPLESTTSQLTLTTIPGIYTDTVRVRDITTITHNRLDMSYTNMPNVAGDVNLLTANPCWPQVLSPDAEPGFALFAHDPYYHAGMPNPGSYAAPPAASITQSKTPPMRRGLPLEIRIVDDADADGPIVTVDEGNSTRRASDEEMSRYANIYKCKDSECSEETSQIREWLTAAEKQYEEVLSAKLADMPVGGQPQPREQQPPTILTDSVNARQTDSVPLLAEASVPTIDPKPIPTGVYRGRHRRGHRHHHHQS